MRDLFSMLWVELRKALRSRMPLWTALGSLFLPFGIGFLIFVARNPEISRKLGLISAKADLLAYSATDWQAYLRVYGLILAAGGYFLFVLVISWVFGREFADGTVKDSLAVPVSRASILLAKFAYGGDLVVWLDGLIVVAGFLTGTLIGLPGRLAGCVPGWRRAAAGHYGSGPAGIAAVRLFRQPGTGLHAPDRYGSAGVDGSEYRDNCRLGGILPLGGSGHIRSGRKPTPYG